jgi:ketosteroid isomerase-like protein
MDSSAPDPQNRTKTAVNDLLTCIATGDIPGLLRLFAEEAVWEVPGDTENLPWLGKRSRDQIPGFFSAMAELTTREAFDINRTIIDGEDAVLIGHARLIFKPTGARIDTPFAIHIAVAEHGITSFYMFEDSWSAALAAQPAAAQTRP